METLWLQCKVLPGMFSHELLVVISDPDRGELASILVDDSIVRITETPTADRAVDGFLRVDAVAKGGRMNVMLPVASAEVGSIVSVPPELLAPQEAR